MFRQSRRAIGDPCWRNGAIEIVPNRFGEFGLVAVAPDHSRIIAHAGKSALQHGATDALLERARFERRDPGVKASRRHTLRARFLGKRFRAQGWPQRCGDGFIPTADLLGHQCLGASHFWPDRGFNGVCRSACAACTEACDHKNACVDLVSHGFTPLISAPPEFSAECGRHKALNPSGRAFRGSSPAAFDLAFGFGGFAFALHHLAPPAAPGGGGGAR